jgi:hypothetical protein
MIVYEREWTPKIAQHFKRTFMKVMRIQWHLAKLFRNELGVRSWDALVLVLPGFTVPAQEAMTVFQVVRLLNW